MGPFKVVNTIRNNSSGVTESSYCKIPVEEKLVS